MKERLMIEHVVRGLIYGYPLCCVIKGSKIEFQKAESE